MTGISCGFHVHDGTLYVRLQFLVGEPRKWATLSDISKALVKLKESSQTPAGIGLPGNALDGKWLNAKLASKCVWSQHKTVCAVAMATAAASLQFPWGNDETLPLSSPCAAAPASTHASPSQPTLPSTAPPPPIVPFRVCTCLYFCLPFAIHVAIKCPSIVHFHVCTSLYFCLPFAIHVAIKCPPTVTLCFCSYCNFSVPFTCNITINSPPTITFCLCAYPNCSCHTFYKTAPIVVGYVYNQVPLRDCHGCVPKHAGTTSSALEGCSMESILLGVETIFINLPQTDKDRQRSSTEFGWYGLEWKGTKLMCIPCNQPLFSVVPVSPVSPPFPPFSPGFPPFCQQTCLWRW